MDIYIEQLYAMPSDTANRLKKAGIIAAAVLLIGLLVFLAFTVLAAFSAILVLLAFGVGYLAFFLYGKLKVEYEYILTAGVVDIDRIQNQRRRKRVGSFTVADVSGIGKAERAPVGHEVRRFCARDDGYYFAFGNDLIIFAPNERFREEMCKYLPRYLKSELQ